MKRLNEAKPGEFILVSTKMVDGNNNEEFREILYRVEDRPVKNPQCVATVRLRTIQTTFHGQVRYDSGALIIRDPGESHGLTPIEDPWSSKAAGLMVDAVKNLQVQEPATP